MGGPAAAGRVVHHLHLGLRVLRLRFLAPRATGGSGSRAGQRGRQDTRDVRAPSLVTPDPSDHPWQSKRQSPRQLDI
eukprot:469713-Pyramimonas_sp.AAC.1